MKKLLIILLLLVTSFANAKGRETRGTVLKSLQFKSEILDTIVNYSVYLPANYEKSGKKYPVLYLLHGYTDNETNWIKWGWVDEVADKEILSGEVDDMIIIMPNGWLLWYVNQPDGKFNYEDMFVKELIPFVEKEYRIKSDKKNRSIGGLSMGGYGALGYSMRHTDLFATCIAYSAAIRPDDEVLKLTQKHFDGLYAPVYGKNVEGKARLSKHWNENNPIYLANKISAEELQSVNWYITIGDDDWLYYGNSVLRKIFRDRKIPHEYRVYEGNHNWNYWRAHIGEGLQFITKYLRMEK